MHFSHIAWLTTLLRTKIPQEFQAMHFDELGSHIVVFHANEYISFYMVSLIHGYY